MGATLAELAALVGGRLVGDGSLVIRGAAPLADAVSGQITLIDDPERAKSLRNCRASAAVGPKALQPNGMPVILVDDVHQAFAAVVARFRPPRKSAPVGVSSQATISPTAKLGAGVTIHPGATIGDEVVLGDRAVIHGGVRIMDGCKIGPRVTIFPNAVLYENTEVGPGCTIHAGCVLGAYGFGYDSSTGRHELSAQLGNVILEADVEIGANSTVDRGTYGSTVIGEGTKIDNQVMVAHNCRIGKHNLLCAQVGIAGSCTTGDYVVMAGQVGIRDHVRIGNQTILGAMAGVIGDVPDGAQMVGIPATPIREQKIRQVAFGKLPAMRKQLKALQATVDQLQQSIAALEITTSSR